MTQRLLLLGGLFLVLVVVVVLVPPQDERQVPLTVYSAEPGGGKALRLWLEVIGYPVTTLEDERYTIGQDVGTVLLLAPSLQLTGREVGTLERWTRGGGRLIVVTGDPPIPLGNPLAALTRATTTGELLSRFGVSVRPLVGSVRTLPAEAGLLDPAIEPVTVRAPYELVLNDRATGATPLLLGERTDQGGPVTTPPDTGRRPILAARVPANRGEVIVLSVPGIFSNAGLHDRSNARLALSLIGPAGRGQLAFDELHHGFGARQARSMYALLLEQAWGRTALLAGLVVTVFLILRGRRLGRAVPIFVDRGRSLGELVTSQAGLLRAGGKRAFVVNHLERQLRADLAQTVGLPADATDQEIAGRASAMGRDPSSALRALDRTRRARSDRELLAVTRDATRAQAELTRAGTTDRSPTSEPSGGIVPPKREVAG